MVYALTVIVITQTLLIAHLISEGRKERKGLEDRLMTLYNPVSLVTHKAVTDPEVGDVMYVDEQAELVLQGEVD